MPSIQPWITTLYFYQPDSPPGQVLLSSSSYSRRSAPASDQWWPEGVGSESENIGNVVVLRSLPASLVIGLRIVAYGEGDAAAALDATISPDSNPAAPLVQQRDKVRFSPLYDGSVLGVASSRFALRLAIEEPGMYWLSAAIGEGPIMQLPLFITLRSDWNANF